MMDALIAPNDQAIRVYIQGPNSSLTHAQALSPFQQRWIEQCGFLGKPGQRCLLPNESGELAAVIYAVEDLFDMWGVAKLAHGLPQGAYRLVRPDNLTSAQWFNWHLAWGWAGYQYTRYKKSQSMQASLCVAQDLDRSRLDSWLQAIYLAQDAINTPCEQMNPQDLAALVKQTGEPLGASVELVEGDALLTQNFPTIHLVGRGSNNPPCLIDLTWGDPAHTKVTLVGKGVCFDTGGLDIKSAAGMLHMKKDMGGGACALALAQMIMQQKLPIHLRLLIPAVENVVSSNCMKPGDIVTTRAGSSVEITNTDAEGRLVLCDALTYALEASPDYLFDFATLTGAARVALGPQIAALYSQDQALASALVHAAYEQQDLAWQLPLHAPYESYLKSEIADIANAANTGFAGSITAALYLQKFVPDDVKWVHYDLFAWNQNAQPGRAKGAQAQVIRGVFSYLENHIKEG